MIRVVHIFGKLREGDGIEEKGSRGSGKTGSRKSRTGNRSAPVKCAFIDAMGPPKRTEKLEVPDGDGIKRSEHEMVFII